MLNYDYTASKLFCEQNGMNWLGDEFVRAADHDAFNLQFTQEQIDLAMRHHIWQVKFLFSPKSYTFKNRFILALHFLFGK